jgi:hypothetical protein
VLTDAYEGGFTTLCGSVATEVQQLDRDPDRAEYLGPFPTVPEARHPGQQEPGATIAAHPRPAHGWLPAGVAVVSAPTQLRADHARGWSSGPSSCVIQHCRRAPANAMPCKIGQW